MLLVIICDVENLAPRNVLRNIVEMMDDAVESRLKEPCITVAKFEPSDWVATALYIFRTSVYNPVTKLFNVACCVAVLNIERIRPAIALAVKVWVNILPKLESLAENAEIENV